MRHLQDSPTEFSVFPSEGELEAADEDGGGGGGGGGGGEIPFGPGGCTAFRSGFQ